MVLDVDLTAELTREGVARDLVRAVQQRRRELDLDVTDRIGLELAGDSAVVEAVQAHGRWIAEQVLAEDLRMETAPTFDDSASDGWHQVSLSDQMGVWVRITPLRRGAAARPG